MDWTIRSLGLMCNSREHLATRENGLYNSRERIAIRENDFSNSRERIAIRENELSNSRERITNQWERITNPWERIAQIDITIYLWHFLKIPMSFQGFCKNPYPRGHEIYNFGRPFLGRRFVKKYSNFTLFTPKLPPLWVGGVMQFTISCLLTI